MRPVLVVGAVALGAGLLGFVCGVTRRPPPAGPSRDSTALVALADSIGRLLTQLDAASDSAQTDLAASGQHATTGQAALDAGDAERPRVPPPPALAVDADTAALLDYYRAREGYLEDQVAYQSRKAADYRLSAASFREAQESAVKAASRWYTSYQRARETLDLVQDSLPKVAVRLGQLEGRLRRGRWGAGVLGEPADLLTGGYVSRRLGAIDLTLAVTDGPHEPTTLRVGAGLHW